MNEKKDVVVYTYKGLSKEESENWLAAMRANVALPNTTEYRIKSSDGGAVLKAKKDRQKEFLAMREKEIQMSLKQHQKYRTVGKITFTKGEALSTDKMVDDNEDPVVLNLNELWKLNCLTKNGVFDRKPALTQKDVERPDPKKVK